MTRLCLESPIDRSRAVNVGTLAPAESFGDFRAAVGTALSGLSALRGRSCTQLRGEPAPVGGSLAHVLGDLLRFRHFEWASGWVGCLSIVQEP